MDVLHLDYWAVLEKTLIAWVALLALPLLFTGLLAWMFNVRVAAIQVGAGPTVLTLRKLRIRLLPTHYAITLWHTDNGEAADFALDSRPGWQQNLLRCTYMLVLLLASFGLLQGAAIAAFQSGLYQPFLAAWSPLSEAQTYLGAYLEFAAAEPLPAVVGLIAAKLLALAVLLFPLSVLIVKLDSLAKARPAWWSVSQKVMLMAWLLSRLFVLLWGVVLVVWIYRHAFQV